jgi:hypothetical protein
MRAEPLACQEAKLLTVECTRKARCRRRLRGVNYFAGVLPQDRHDKEPHIRAVRKIEPRRHETNNPVTLTSCIVVPMTPDLHQSV